MGVVSCKNSGSGGAAPERKPGRLQAVSGKLNQIMVIINNATWEGAVGDTLRSWFGQDYDGLPQAEPIFDLIHLPKEFFNKEVKIHRNILQIEISSLVDSSAITYMESPWANTQKVIRIAARTPHEFLRLFDENKIRITATFSRAERDRLISIYRRTPEASIHALFMNKYNLDLYAPTGYYIRRDTLGFVWLSAETQRYSQGIAFFSEEYKDESQFNHFILIDRMNEQLQRFMPASLPGSYMQIDKEIPYTLNQFTHKGHYAITIRGLWTAVNDFMAGPFELQAILDENGGRIIYLMSYVYYPNELKRNMMKQLNAILQSVDIPGDIPSK